MESIKHLFDSGLTLDQLKREYMRMAMVRCKTPLRAAKRLGVSERTMYVFSAREGFRTRQRADGENQ